MKLLAPPPGEPALEKQVATLIAKISTDSEIHQHFEGFRRRIAEDRSLMEMLRQLRSPNDRIN